MKTLMAITDRVLKGTIVSEEAIRKLRSVSEVDWLEEGRRYSSEDMKAIIQDYDAYVTSWGSPKLTSEVLDEAVNLKFVGHAAGTVTPYMDEDIFARGITVTNANKGLARSTAEGTIAFMMAAAWRIPEFSSRLKAGGWSENSRESVMGIGHQTVGIVGLGEIAREVIRMLSAFQADIVVHSKHCSQEEADRLGVRLCGLDELFEQSTIVSIHTTLHAGTRGMIGSRQLSLLQEGSLLVNTARGPIIDENALIEVLESRNIYAALDVYHKEPLRVDHRLLKLPNVLCTPHIGGYAHYWKSRQVESVVDDLIRFLQGEELEHRITLEMFRRLTLER